MVRTDFDFSAQSSASLARHDVSRWGSDLCDTFHKGTQYFVLGKPTCTKTSEVIKEASCFQLSHIWQF